MGTSYADFFGRVGFPEEAAAIAEKWQNGDRVGAAETVNDELVEVFTLGTDGTTARQGIEVYGQRGVDVVVVAPPRGCHADEIAQTLEAMRKVGAYNPT